MKPLYRPVVSEPMALGVLAGILMFLVVVIALSMSCAYRAAPRPYGTPRATGRAQLDATVAVVVACNPTDPTAVSGWGSGVLLDSRHVLTAHHVVECKTTPTLAVATTDGAAVLARVVQVDEEHDAALLELEDAVHDVAPPQIAPAPTPGQTVCVLTAMPELASRCGRVLGHATMIQVDGKKRHAVHASSRMEPGNSGGALYDSLGRLVGIAIAYDVDDQQRPTGTGSWFIPIAEVSEKVVRP